MQLPNYEPIEDISRWATRGNKKILYQAPTGTDPAYYCRTSATRQKERRPTITDAQI